MKTKILVASVLILLAFGFNAFAVGNLSVQKTAQNITNNTVFVDSVPANFGDEIIYKVIISSGQATSTAVYAKDIVPAGMTYLGGLTINGAVDSRNITEGILLGDISTSTSKTILYKAKVNSQEFFNFGTSNLISSVLAYNTGVSVSDTATVVVVKKAIAGSATNVSTGIVDNLFGSLLLPLGLAAILLFIFKSQILGFDKWASIRRESTDCFRAQKRLNHLIKKRK